MSGRGHPLLSRNGLFLLSSTCDERSLKWNLWPGKHLRFIGVPVLRINSFWPVVREHHQIALLDASLDAWAYGTRLCWTLFKCSGEVVLPVVVLLFYAWTTLFIEGHWKTLSSISTLLFFTEMSLWIKFVQEYQIVFQSSFTESAESERNLKKK